MDVTPHAGTGTPHLEGVRILDLTRILAGPYCSLLLGEMGADVIKVEPPGTGDHSRRAGSSGARDGLHYLAWNFHRRSITLNMYEEEGRTIFRKLVEGADVVLENFRPGVMARMGFGYDDLKQIKPNIILTSVSGYGQNTSFSSYPAHNTVVLSFTGLMDLNGFADGPPLRPPGSMGDAVAGTYAALGTLAALYRKQANGTGEHVDIAMMDCLVGQIAYDLANYIVTGEEATRKGNGSADRAFHNVYRTRDGWIYIQADLENQWKRLAETMGKSELLDDPRFRTEAGRVNHKEELDAIAQEWVKDRARDDVFHLLAGAGVPASPVNTVADVAAHPHLKERGMLHEVEHPGHGKLPALTPRIRFEDTPSRKPAYPPMLGENNEEVYREMLGYDESTLAGLKERGII